MKMQKRAPTIIVATIALALAGLACDGSEPEPSAPTATPTIERSPTKPPDTPTSTPEPSHTPTQTAEPRPTPAPAHRDTSGVRVGMLADDVLELRGQANNTRVVGEDQFGLIVEWWYADSVYTMARREAGGITAYRVIQVHAP